MLHPRQRRAGDVYKKVADGGDRSPWAPKLSSQRIDSHLDNSSSIEMEGPTDARRGSCSPTLC